MNLSLLVDPIAGRTPLKTVIVAYGLIPNVVFAIGIQALFGDSPSGISLILAMGLCLGVYQAVAIWQCAFNGTSRRLGSFLRFCLISGVAGFIAIAILLGVPALDR